MQSPFTSRRWPSTPMRYGVAVVCALAALSLRMALEPSIGDNGPYSVFFFGCIIAAWYGGYGPGLIAMVIGFLAGNYFFMPPEMTLGIKGQTDFSLILSYLAMTTCSIALIEGLHRARQRANLAMADARQHAMQVEFEMTQRQRAEASRNESLLRLDQALEAGRMGTWEWNIATGEVAWSHTLEAVHGLEPGTFGGSFDDFQRDMHPDDRGRVICSIDNTLRNNCEYQEQYRIIRPDGNVAWLETRGRVVRDRQGKPIRMTGVCADVTERNSAQIALDHTHNKLENVLATMSSVFYMLDDQWRFTFMNNKAETYFGMPREHMLGRSIWEVASKAAGTICQERFRSVMQRREPVHFEVHSPVSDLWLEVHAYPSDGGISVFLDDISPRKAAEAQLRKSEARFRQLAETMPQIVWATDPGGVMTFLNQQWETYTGLTLEQAGDSAAMESILHPEDAPRVKKHWQDCLVNGTPYDAQVRIRRHSDGAFRWFLIRGVPVRDEHGGIREWFGAATDIHEQKQTEQALRDSEALYRAIGEAIDYGIWICDAQGRNVYASQSFLDLVGLTQEQCSEFGWGAVLHPDDAKRTIAMWKQCAATGTFWDIEHRFRGVDGQYHPVLARGVPIRNERGEIMHWAGINLDISSLKKAERALRESEEIAHRRLAELASVYNSAPVGLCFLDAQLCFVKANAQLAWLSGKSVDEHIGRNIREIASDFADVVQPMLQQVIRTGESLHDVEISGRIPHEPDIQRYWLVNFHPVKARNGQMLGINVVVQDITERKHIEQEIQLHREHLEKLVLQRTLQLEKTHQHLRLSERLTAMGTLSAGIGHDMGNLLLPMKSRLQVLNSIDLPPQAKEHVNAIEFCIKHLYTLVRGLRLFAQDPERRDPNDATDLDAWIRETQPLYASMVHKNIKVASDIPDDLPPIAMAPHTLTQAVRNLVKNSRDAIGTERSGVIMIRARRGATGEQVRLTVQDNGAGMTAEVRARAVEPFFTTKTRSLTTGMGLSIVHGMVRAVGGGLEIQSPPISSGTEPAISFSDQSAATPGTAVTLVIPVSSPRTAGSGQPSSNGTRLAAAISIADPRTQAMLTSMLDSLGFSVVQARHGQPGSSDVWFTEHSADRFIAAREFLNAKPDRTVVVVGDAPPEWSSLPVKMIDQACKPSAVRAVLQP